MLRIQCGRFSQIIQGCFKKNQTQIIAWLGNKSFHNLAPAYNAYRVDHKPDAICFFTF